ncbi:hypothetical protein CPT_Piffle_076 [Stenotrophomonas phage Piffle]|uniref:Uncharacterized protein n=2 Tax=Pokkenvirus TaxID=2842972 RepID=A0AAE8BJ97_9CAUD|nr:hypothetical protein PP761_gp54 [Stenotrophomonas phage Paxi]YP_010659487.1 hypothetical protein PP762_gp56 [Stenotrophomonas phage Piffle]QYW01841.1 hypothetical protein CPT_Paxi_075 [Stenotrophomonas phage Paxi]QYW01930.1 hypothetical protein CPT_Piffle_076 [Stenotrophomonas phage Piffle]
MQTEVNIESLTRQLDGAKAAQKKLAAMERLFKNKDFKELILQDYCINEAARLVHASLSPSFDTENQKKFLTMAQACGGILLWAEAQETLLNTQVRQIPDIEEALEEARQEDQGAAEDSED